MSTDLKLLVEALGEERDEWFTLSNDPEYADSSVAKTIALVAAGVCGGIRNRLVGKMTNAALTAAESSFGMKDTSSSAYGLSQPPWQRMTDLGGAEDA